VRRRHRRAVALALESPAWNESAVDRLLSEQCRYYGARAPEYDDWWFWRARYNLDAEAAEGWFADVAELEGATCGNVA
jgi:hypothetical protein